MEVSPNLYARFGNTWTSKNKRLIQAYANLKVAIESSKRTSPKEETPAKEEDVQLLQDKIAVLLGDSFRLSWSTVDEVRALHHQDLLPEKRKLFRALCKKHLRTQDCPSPWQLLYHYEWLSLTAKREVTEKLILSHFMEAVEDPDFVDIPAFTLAQFLSSPHLVLEREVDAVHALMRWLNKDTTTKTNEVEHLLQFIHLERLNREELMELDNVLKLLCVPVTASITFQRRHTRLELWTLNLGVRIYLALNLSNGLELNELNVSLRCWDTRSLLLRSSFQPETITGSNNDLYIIGDEDTALVFRNDTDRIDKLPLSREFLGPVAYRCVCGQLYAVQNQGWKIQVWKKDDKEWTCLSCRISPVWMYEVQVYANQRNLFIAGKRDTKLRLAVSGPKSGSMVPNTLGKKVPFVWIYHRQSRTFQTGPLHPNTEVVLENLGATTEAFWAVDTSSGKIWMLDISRLWWHETKLSFPAGDHVVSSASCGNSLLILSCNITRGAYITLSLLSDDSEPQFGVIGSVPLDCQKFYIDQFMASARFHVLTESRPYF